jgi:hypothetical protein
MQMGYHWAPDAVEVTARRMASLFPGRSCKAPGARRCTLFIQRFDTG